MISSCDAIGETKCEDTDEDDNNNEDLLKPRPKYNNEREQQEGSALDHVIAALLLCKALADFIQMIIGLVEGKSTQNRIEEESRIKESRVKDAERRQSTFCYLLILFGNSFLFSLFSQSCTSLIT